ncbi:uncharacterized protein ACLA_026310 [Aspergillus clavatus NRRL 1]|uniref:Uncharacterized protein n=1 Tax=Aspergillus clavatus (strain ATCC 1007 / CBS 513.65 / DSM 816 / NCTC 3887 / NRRL 1 / QM 1276 / 107) TaxID=344612 RepID=A1CQJ3_ASPCL|nr:uncharacterized protein ACLA_026310 [Aspergillus clavatus NRRL 1]EAW07914.1 conserved hypothetical protein [Aspergillus clavatus NRRL 1]
MSDEPRPITLEAFAEAIKELPLSAVYAKVLEIRNSIAHLHRSNSELTEFINESCESESDKRELEGYIAENEGVITNMTERLGLLKSEIERRGEPWIEELLNGADTKTDGDQSSATPASQPVVNGMAEGDRNTEQQDTSRGPQDTQADNEEGVYL